MSDESQPRGNHPAETGGDTPPADTGDKVELNIQQPGDLNLSEGAKQNVIPITVSPSDAADLPATGLNPPEGGSQGSEGAQPSNEGSSSAPPEE